nr:zinc ribbon domain-containing protein [Blautia wexlerae]
MHHVEVGEVGEKVCPNCRMPLPENARFCAECGSRIDITVTRKELGESSLGVESGLKIERNAAITSPFYEKCDSLKDKIVNPELKPLPEKKKFVFRSWDDIKNSTIETGKLEFGEKETEESENGGIEQNIEENIEQLNEEAESENYDVTIEKSTIEEVNMEESDAEEPNIEELNTEEPNIEEAETEELNTEEPNIEEAETEELDNEKSNIEELNTEEPNIEKSDIEQQIEECPIELPEEPTDFEALKGMFDENKDDLIEEEIGENPELLEPDRETETGKQAVEEVINTISLETVIQSENLQPSIAVPDHKEELAQEENKTKNVDAALKDIGDKICNQIDEETEIAKLENVKKVNRIITSSVGGGFRYKSPQAEEAKEITAILKKRNKN